MWSLLFSSFAVTSLGAYCSMNSNSTACQAPEVSTCVNVCTLYQTQAGCGSVAGCTWSTTNFMGMVSGSCSAGNSSVSCGSYSTSQDCNNTMCKWQTLPCQFKMACKSGGSTNGSSSVCTSTPSMVESDCTSQAGCVWRGECDESDRCKILPDQTNCVGSSGCFWATGSLSAMGVTSSSGGCGLCFEDPSNSENNFLTIQSHVGQTCSQSVLFLTATYRYTSATPAPTGCTGGAVIPDPPGVTCGAAGLSASLAMLMAAIFLA